ncbi:hypothetical protein [Tautonia plasticadhaerens]|uniref:hypothetical protein n=1 Tax=Tautonia plasticadhaerens TaxID=2527974 RepID=UPI0011A7DC73|nr:hypothetical protein [Tautonia plasticadhaerens]
MSEPLDEGIPWRSFEDEVYNAVRSAVTRGYFPFTADVQVRRNATYHSRASGNAIRIEVSLEAFRQGSTDPFLIWLWECKQKSKREVEIGTVHELHSKIQGIGVGRAKGSIVTTIGFQSGAVREAEALGISLYHLDKELVPITKYARSEPDELREVIFAVQSFDFAGQHHSRSRFDDMVRHGLRLAMSEYE